jgi:lysozyme
MMVLDAVIPSLMRDEGFRRKPYRCSAGKLTIGFGTNLDEGLDDDEAMFLLEHRLAQRVLECRQAFPFFERLGPVRQGVIVQMAYQLGTAGVMEFRNMRRALEAGDYAAAADAMVDSKWARSDSPARAHRLADAMRGGRSSSS